MDAPPSLWIVLDKKDGPEFAAAWREGAHDHIKDCLDEGIHEAARWVVREYTPIADTIERAPVVARPLAEWHEDMGAVLWWLLPVDEPPYCGKPGDSDWPGYHTHWTPIVVPSNAAQGAPA